MAVGLKLSPYFIAGSFIVCINFYCVYELLSKNKNLKAEVRYFKQALTLGKQKQKLQQESWQEQLTKKLRRIKELDNQVMSSHSALGNLQSVLVRLRRDIASKSNDVEKLQEIGSNHKNEITNLQTSLTKSKDALSELSEKTNKLMSEALRQKDIQKVKNQNLVNQIKTFEADRLMLDDMIVKYKRTNLQLSQQVSNLTHMNNVMREGIQKKIEESYKRKDAYAIPKQHETVVKVTSTPVSDDKLNAASAKLDRALPRRGDLLPRHSNNDGGNMNSKFIGGRKLIEAPITSDSEDKSTITATSAGLNHALSNRGGLFPGRHSDNDGENTKSEVVGGGKPVESMTYTSDSEDNSTITASSAKLNHALPHRGGLFPRHSNTNEESAKFEVTGGRRPVQAMTTSVPNHNSNSTTTTSSANHGRRALPHRGDLLPRHSNTDE